MDILRHYYVGTTLAPASAFAAPGAVNVGTAV